MSAATGPVRGARAAYSLLVKTRSVPWQIPVVRRDPHEPGRVASPLELFFDLVFVVAIASAGAQLHHALAEGHYGQIVGFAMTFVAIWWAWMSYT